jgi:hypothetical protein
VYIRIQDYINDRDITIYQLAKAGGYGYTTIYKSYNKSQSKATPLNLRDIEVIAKYQHKQMWEILKELEDNYMEE